MAYYPNAETTSGTLEPTFGPRSKLGLVATNGG